MMVVDLADKANVASAVGNRTLQLHQAYAEAQGQKGLCSSAHPQALLHSAAATRDLLTRFQVLCSSQGGTTDSTVDEYLSQTPVDVLQGSPDALFLPSKLARPIKAEELEMRATVWLCVWLSCPHVHEEEREEMVAGLGEALAAVA